MGPQGRVKFGPFDVTTQVFFKTPLSFALVNIKPILPGHVLVCPSVPHARLADLSPDEVRDLFTTVQRVQAMLARRYFPARASSPSDTPAGSFNIAIQDGADAGQTVPHVHVHILPRPAATADEGMMPGTQGNAVYEAMTTEEANIGGALWDAELGARPAPAGGFTKADELERKPRPMEEMVAEAKDYATIMEDMD